MTFSDNVDLQNVKGPLTTQPFDLALSDVLDKFSLDHSYLANNISRHILRALIKTS